jgi:hypothetical protein
MSKRFEWYPSRPPSFLARVRNLRRFFVLLPRVYTSFTRGIAVVTHFPYPEQICNYLVYVLLHRDQHFIERESYRSGREMALEIQDKSWYIACTLSPLYCVTANRASGPSFQLSLIPSRCREEGVSSTIPSGSLDLQEGGLSARSCLRGSQAICSSQESLETIICNEDIDNKDRNHLQRTGGVS